VTITSDNAAAVVPSSVLIPAGVSAKSFTITTAKVTQSTLVHIKAKFGLVTLTATLTVTP